MWVRERIDEKDKTKAKKKMRERENCSVVVEEVRE
jgi:hypothetical protein